MLPCQQSRRLVFHPLIFSFLSSSMSALVPARVLWNSRRQQRNRSSSFAAGGFRSSGTQTRLLGGPAAIRLSAADTEEELLLVPVGEQLPQRFISSRQEPPSQLQPQNPIPSLSHLRSRRAARVPARLAMERRRNVFACVQRG